MSANRRKGGRWCSAVNCTNNSNINTDISFFSFPKEEERARKWSLNCRREDLTRKSVAYLSKNCNICSVHFEDAVFANFLRNRLKPDAVPTIFYMSDPFARRSKKRKSVTKRNYQSRKQIGKAKTIQMFSSGGRSSELCNVDIKIEIEEDPLQSESILNETNQFAPPKIEMENANVLLECKNNVHNDNKLDTNPQIKHELHYSLETANKTGSHIVDIPFKCERDPSIEFGDETVIESSDSDVVSKKEIKDDLWWQQSNSSDIQLKSEHTSQSELKVGFHKDVMHFYTRKYGDHDDKL